MDFLSQIADNFDTKYPNIELVSRKILKKQILIFGIPIDSIELILLKKPFLNMLTIY